LEGKDLFFPEFPVISEARKKIPPRRDCLQSWAPIFPNRWWGNRLFLRGSLILSPAALCGWPTGGSWKADIPPMLATQSAFSSGPLEGFYEKFGQRICRLAEHD